MRRARIKVSACEEPGVYHLISRTVNGEWMFGAAAKEILRRQMRQIAEFAGLEIITWTVLSDHFHILVRVPRRPELSDEELLRRHAILYPKPTKYQAMRLEVIAAELPQNTPRAQAWRKRLLSLMYDISPFMKLLKERFSIWYNARHDRFGPVWADRFKSTIVEDTARVVLMVAAYIDLNAVRAGIVKDPKDYRFCGYAEAVAGQHMAQRGLCAVVGGTWAEAQASYRLLLFTVGAGPRERKAALTLEQVRKVVREGGKLPLPEVLRCRVRYFGEAAVLGGREFVERHVVAYRKRFALTDRVARQELPAATDWDGLSGLRPLRAALLG